MKRLVVALLLTMATPSIGAPIGAASDVAALQARAQAGDAESQFQMGEAYRAGRGVSVDPETAIIWYRRAAGQGHIRASEELGFALFAHGDRREAMPYIEKAAARGEARAFYLLGTAHFNGDYATRDWPLAYAQTQRAAAAGLVAAQKNLTLMDHYLLPADKAKAEQVLATLPSVRSAQPDGGATSARKSAMNEGATLASAPPRPKALKPATRTVSLGNDAPGVTAKAPKAGGDWKVQLGAFGSADRAREQWKTLRSKVPDLAAYQQHLVPVGTVQRLQAANIAGRADAQALCKKVVGAGGDCLVIAP